MTSAYLSEFTYWSVALGQHTFVTGECIVKNSIVLVLACGLTSWCVLNSALKGQGLTLAAMDCSQEGQMTGNAESGSIDNDGHEDVDLDKFSELVHSKQEGRRLSMYNKRHGS